MSSNCMGIILVVAHAIASNPTSNPFICSLVVMTLCLIDRAYKAVDNWACRLYSQEEHHLT